MNNKCDQNNHKTNHHCCKGCICETLLKFLDRQKNRTQTCQNTCDLKPVRKSTIEVIPFILQTPYGDPFFTWGNIGKRNCFVTVFFKVIRVDCEKNCAILQLLKPNVTLLDGDTGSIEIANLCKVDFLVPTEETVLVELSCYSAVKSISPKIIKNK